MSVSSPENSISLDDKYNLERPTVLISGRQALVRLPLAQRELDRRRGWQTAGLISGYRGSPLGSYDLDLWKAGALLQRNDILFQPGLNEDLALTALSGSQLLDLLPERKFDGVFALWYGKGRGHPSSFLSAIFAPNAWHPLSHAHFSLTVSFYLHQGSRSANLFRLLGESPICYGTSNPSLFLDVQFGSVPILTITQLLTPWFSCIRHTENWRMFYAL